MPNTKAKTRKRVKRLLNAKLKREGRTPAQIKRNREKAARKKIANQLLNLPVWHYGIMPTKITDDSDTPFIEIDEEHLIEGYDGNNQVNNYA